MADRDVRPPHGWPTGPTSDAVAEIVRDLEVTITRRLDGVLHGNHHGLTPGHGSEPGEARPYQPGDDVRRIDWNVTARTRETHVREQIADRDLEAWVMVDASTSMRFGTTGHQKAQIALAATAAIGFLTARNQNRLGAVVVAGPDVRVVPPRAGRVQVRAVLAAVAGAPESEGRGRPDLGVALDRIGAMAKRRGFVAIVSDLAGDGWHDAVARVGLRHDLLAVLVDDPRELDVPPIGLVDVVDPATGDAVEIRVTREVQRRFADAARRDRAARLDALHRAGADVIELPTDADWLGEIARHVQRRRTQIVRGGVLGRPSAASR